MTGPIDRRRTPWPGVEAVLVTTRHGGGDRILVADLARAPRAGLGRSDIVLGGTRSSARAAHGQAVGILAALPGCVLVALVAVTGECVVLARGRPPVLFAAGTRVSRNPAARARRYALRYYVSLCGAGFPGSHPGADGVSSS
ncbi:hypothetical protein [Saccharomonospora halophila]|uniref:hypothetical protein n=1 Tax=Saccharomonospora halophila TaxID=129922 RepID=UPI0003681740|nr:hypothetical protein [Saccharomonospora halophila]